MNATFIIIQTYETRRGVAWTGIIRTDITGTMVDIRCTNEGNGGMTFIESYTKRDREVVLLLTNWAKTQISDDFPLESIVDCTDHKETLDCGVQRLKELT